MIELEWCGQIEYQSAWDRQKELVRRRTVDALCDRVLLLEHPPTYTMGRRGTEANLVFSPAEREAEGISLHWVDRGGDVTYHGPGQLVAYPIFNIRELHRALGRDRPDLHLYLRQLEDVLVQTLAAFDVKAWRYEGYTGVWVTTTSGPRKIAAIGIKVNSKGIASHGFALNVNPDMRHFAGIIPCGIDEHGVISMSELLGRSLSIGETLPHVAAAFAEVFQQKTNWLVQPQLTT